MASNVLEPFPASLPSSQSAAKFVAGQEGGLSGIVLHTIGRAALMAPALYAVGHFAPGLRKNKAWLKGALAGACAIEVYVLGYTAVQYNKAQKAKKVAAPV